MSISAPIGTGRLFASIELTSSSVTSLPTPQIILNIHRSVAKDARLVARQTVDALRKILRLADVIEVQVVPGMVVQMPDGGKGFGVFRVGSWSGVTIVIGGIALPPRLMKRSDWLVQLREVICHEFAHYEQFRDGRKVSERGVRVRTRTLLRLIEQERQ